MKRLHLVDSSKSDILYEKSSFPDGQQNITLYPCIVEEDVQITSRLNNWKDLELIIASVACLKNLGCKNIHLYTPYILGARSDRQFTIGGNNYLKDVLCPIINSLNLASITCIDPHSDCLEMGLNNFRKVSNTQLVKWVLSNEPFITGNGFEILSPDGGALKKIYKLTEEIDYLGEVIVCSKSRNELGKLSKITVPKTSLKKDLIIIDDLIDGGGTFINIAKRLREEGFKKKLYLIVTHGIFSKPLQEIIQHFNGIFCTNSYRELPKKENYKSPDFVNDFIKQLNVFDYYAVS